MSPETRSCSVCLTSVVLSVCSVTLFSLSPAGSAGGSGSELGSARRVLIYVTRKWRIVPITVCQLSPQGAAASEMSHVRLHAGGEYALGN